MAFFCWVSNFFIKFGFAEPQIIEQSEDETQTGFGKYFVIFFWAKNLCCETEQNLQKPAFNLHGLVGVSKKDVHLSDDSI